jgi:hypothetical protein
VSGEQGRIVILSGASAPRRIFPDRDHAAARIAPAVRDLPDINLTRGGIEGSDLR